MTGKESRFDFQTDLSYGQEGEALIRRIFGSMRPDLIEVKRDRRAAETGNLFFETECRPVWRGAWQASGINVTAADWWAHIIETAYGGHALFLNVERIRPLVASRMWKGEAVDQPYGDCPTRGILLPLADLLLPIDGNQRLRLVRERSA